jgi:hypothetical protein
MKNQSFSSQRGSAFVTVMGFTIILLLLVASVLKYSGSERKLNNRSKIHLEARLAAEAISEYGIAQVKNILEKSSTFTSSVWTSKSEGLFTPKGTYEGKILNPPDSFWTGSNIVNSSGANAEKPIMSIGKIMDISGGGLVLIDPLNPDNDNDPLKGKRAFRYSLDVLSRATASDPVAGKVTNYMQQSFVIRAAPLFSNAIYYNMDLELQPGPVFTVTGSTHANGRMFVRSASGASSNTSIPSQIRFAGPVTAVKGFWTHFARQTADTNANTANPFFQNYNEQGDLQDNIVRNSTNPGVIDILVSGTTTFKPMRLKADTTGFTPKLTNGTWVESTWNLTPSTETWRQHLGIASSGNTETTATKENYANWTQQTFKGNLMTHVNGLSPMTLPGIPDYSYEYGSAYPDPYLGTTDAAYTYMDSGGNDKLNAAHALIETPRLTTDPSYNEATELIKYSRRAGLYIVVNTTGTNPAAAVTNANGHQPDGTPIKVATRSYRAFMNDMSTGTSVITEVLLPGQDTYGDNNSKTNPWASSSTALNHKDAMPIIAINNIYYTGTNPNWYKEKTAAGDERRMYDMRRFGNYEPPLDGNDPTDRTGTNVYDPKRLYMIDLDVAELRKAVKAISVNIGDTVTNTTDFYATGLPTSGNFSKYIYKDDAPSTFSTVIGDNNQILIAPADPSSPGTKTKAFTDASKWNGAVYIESIAADRFSKASTSDSKVNHRETRKLRDSGVRLINGRGKAPSVNATQGFSLITNDAVYVLGSFNSDGESSTPSTVDQLVPASVGASTGHYPDDYVAGTTPVSDSTELPVSIVCDAVTLLSQPLYTSETAQSNGWNDALSYNRSGSSDWSTSWASANASSSNRRDGDATARKLFKVPYDSGSGDLNSTTYTSKLAPSFSEYSTALLMGLVPTGKAGIRQTSGSLNNFPRFLEDWSGVTCRIRGSFVALFECRVATEPWNIHVYGAPTRVWGFNLIFNEGRMPPLTPKTLSFRRSGAVDIRKDAYNAKLADWGYPEVE